MKKIPQRFQNVWNFLYKIFLEYYWVTSKQTNKKYNQEPGRQKMTKKLKKKNSNYFNNDAE